MNKKDETIFQVINMEDDSMVNWFDSREDAENDLKERAEMWPDTPYEIYPGTNYIYTKCKGCGTVYAEMRSDHYNIPTGYYCDECYNDSSKYIYRKDDYFDPLYAGERMDELD